jgi:putative DNA primase/helicase
MDHDLLGLAVHYVQAGFSVIPIRGDGSKAPALPWSAYQERAPTEAELRDWFDPHTGRFRQGGLALVCGTVSGGFEVLDFDVAEAFTEFRELLAHRGLTPLLQRVSLTATPRPGVHLGLRSSVPGRNQVLARRPRGQEPNRSDLQILCETRGQGGYVLAPAVPAAVIPEAALTSPSPARACRWTASSR